MKDELISLDAIALGELVRKKEIKPTELLEVTIQRIEKIDPKLNAVIHKMYDQARETAANWTTAIQEGKAEGVIFCGVPFFLKDLVAEYKGVPFHEGSRAVKGYISKIPQRPTRAGSRNPMAAHLCYRRQGLLPVHRSE